MADLDTLRCDSKHAARQSLYMVGKIMSTRKMNEPEMITQRTKQKIDEWPR